jgi:hypothetical protein
MNLAWVNKDLVLRSSRSERLEGRVRTLPGEAEGVTTALARRTSTGNAALTDSSFETASFTELRTPPQDKAVDLLS